MLHGSIATVAIKNKTLLNKKHLYLSCYKSFFTKRILSPLIFKPKKYQSTDGHFVSLFRQGIIFGQVIQWITSYLAYSNTTNLHFSPHSQCTLLNVFFLVTFLKKNK